jgi:hypothetical protein
MAITDIAQVYAGLRPEVFVVRSFSGTVQPSGGVFTDIYIAGSVPAAAVPSPGLAGVALTTLVGALPFSNSVNNVYLAGVNCETLQDYGLTYTATTDYNPTKMNYSFMLVDRLWHNSGINATSTSLQNINSVPWPDRDINESVNGEGVYLALENSSATTNSLDSLGYTVTVTYTNSDGVPARTGTTIDMGYITSAGNNFVRQGSWIPISLQAGDTGVQSVQTIQLSSSYGAGPVLHLVAYRPIAMVQSRGSRDSASTEDAITLALPQLWNDSVLQVVRIVYSAYPPPNYQVSLTQG